MAVVLFAPPFWVALGEAIAAVAPYVLGAAALGGTAVAVHEMTKADEEADAQATPIAEADTCANCKEKPCAHLACGDPSAPYRGGAHECVGDSKNKVGEPGSIHSHHMPAKAYSPLTPAAGPAIQMDAADHFQTASYGGNVHGPRYQPQRTALSSGQTMAAIMMDVADVKAIAMAQGDPNKYDSAIGQMLAYAACLKANGIIQ